MPKKNTNNHYRNRIRKVALTVILVSVTPLFLVTGIILYQFHSSYSEKTQAHLVEVVQKHKQNIDAFLWQRRGDILVLAKTFSYEELSNPAFLKDRLFILQQGYESVFVDIGVINEKGIQVAYVGPYNLAQADYASAPWFLQAKEKDFFISDVFLGLRNLPHFIVTVRNQTKAGKTWILRATVDFVAFNSLVEKVRIGETGFAFILNRKGELQTKPFFDVMADKTPFDEFVNNTRKRKDGVSIVKGTDSAGKKISTWLLTCKTRTGSLSTGSLHLTPLPAYMPPRE